MKKLLLLLVLTSTACFGQIVNKEKIETNTVEVWSFVKPFNNQESYFMDYGQKKFRPHYYDHKTQRIANNDGKVFKKGEWVSLINFMEKEGWKKSNERPHTIGNINGRITTFTKS